MERIFMEISLKSIEPSVIRKIEVPSNLTFHELHNIIQIVFGWQNRHLYKFIIKDRDIEIVFDRNLALDYKKAMEKVEEAGESADRKIELPDSFEKSFHFGELFHSEILYSLETHLDDVLAGNEKIEYIYDFGDNWVHQINTSIAMNYGSSKPVLLFQEGLTPPEDVGGIVGYEKIREILENESNPSYESMIKWAKEKGYKSSLRTIEEINEELTLENYVDFIVELDDIL